MTKHLGKDGGEEPTQFSVTNVEYYKAGNVFPKIIHFEKDNNKPPGKFRRVAFNLT